VAADLGEPDPARAAAGQSGYNTTGGTGGTDIDALDDTRLAAAIATTTVFARVSPEYKARIVRLQRLTGRDVAFLGEGVNVESTSRSSG
jgi:Mg2+-importing ATPase